LPLGGGIKLVLLTLVLAELLGFTQISNVSATNISPNVLEILSKDDIQILIEDYV